MAKNKIDRLLKDAENKREEEKQDRIQTKIVIGVPYPQDSLEFGNFMDSIGEMNRDNSFEYTIDVCKMCDECGAVNDTVEEVEIPTEEVTEELRSDKEMTKLKLCDYCFRKVEG